MRNDYNKNISRTSNNTCNSSSSNSSISSVFKHAAELFFSKRRNAGFFSGQTITCPQMFLNITFALALADRQGQGTQIILAVRGMIIILDEE